jgi:hypothetical protein
MPEASGPWETGTGCCTLWLAYWEGYVWVPSIYGGTGRRARSGSGGIWEVTAGGCMCADLRKRRHGYVVKAKLTGSIMGC